MTSITKQQKVTHGLLKWNSSDSS